MEFWSTLLVAVIGSTGAIGALTAGIQLSRRARLRRSIQIATEVSSSVDQASVARATLQQAIETDVIRLASLSLVEMRVMTRFAIGTLIFYTIGAIVLIYLLTSIRHGSLAGFSELSATFDPTNSGTINLQTLLFMFFLLYIPPLVFVFDLALKRDREKLVVEQLARSKFPIETTELVEHKKSQDKERKSKAIR